MKKFNLLFSILSVLSLVGFAQAPNLNNSTKPVADDKPVDGYYKKTNILSAKVTPYSNLGRQMLCTQKGFGER